MEEDRPHINLPTKTLDLDADLQKKHQAMLDRLSNRHQARLDTSLARRSDSANSSESTSSFPSRFSASKQSIDSQLADSSLIATSDPSRLRSHFANISSSISDLEKLVAENSYFLPSYEVRSSLKTIADLKQNLEVLNSELIPKKKFSFKNKATAKKELPKEPEPIKPGTILVSNFKLPNSPGFRNKTNETLVKKLRGTEIGEFTLSDLESCEVRLIGCCNAVFMNRLKNCKVYMGPVIGSILIEEVEGCVFADAYDQTKRLRTGGNYSHSPYTSPSPFHPPAPVWGPHGYMTPTPPYDPYGCYPVPPVPMPTPAPVPAPSSYVPVQNTKDNPPCNTLFIGNLGENINEEELRGLFSAQPGFKQMKILRQERHTVCFIEFEDVSTATNVHHSLQGAVIPSSGSVGMRIQYSKNPFGKRKDSGHLVSSPSANGPPPALTYQ